VPILVPTYSISYAQPAPLKQEQGEEDPLVREVRLLREELRLARGGQAAPEKPETLNLGSLLGSKCIRCHSGETPKAGLSLVDAKGQLPVMSVAERNRIIRRVQARTMPPPKEGALTDAEIKVLTEGLK
jgi:hypothetical protein